MTVLEPFWKGRIEVGSRCSFILDVDDERLQSVIGLTSFLYCFLDYQLARCSCSPRDLLAAEVAVQIVAQHAPSPFPLKPFEPRSMMLDRCRDRTRTLQGKASQPFDHIAVMPPFPGSTQV